MEDYINTALGFISSADVYLLAISGVFIALAAVAKLTKTKKDDKIIARINSLLKKLISYLPTKKRK